MENETNPPGRILRHGKQADELTAGAIERRAHELALIAGRPPAEATDEDRALAKAELRGQSLPDTTLDDADGVARVTRDPSDPISQPGSQTPMRNEPEEQQIEERLALEGVEEAQHDQMLAARRRRREG